MTKVQATYERTTEAAGCTKCGEVKPAVEFHTNKSRKSGITCWCKDCAKTRDQSRYTVGAGLDKTRARYRKWKYGITQDQFESLLEKQGGGCGVCKRADPGKHTWRVDHDHLTGKVRGVLCGTCNSGLGHFKDSPENLRNAIAYLDRSKNDSVLSEMRHDPKREAKCILLGPMSGSY